MKLNRNVCQLIQHIKQEPKLTEESAGVCFLNETSVSCILLASEQIGVTERQKCFLAEKTSRPG